MTDDTAPHPPRVRLAAAVAALMNERDITRAERHGDLPPGMGTLLRQMRMRPSDVGRQAKMERRARNSQPHQGTREQARRRRQMEKAK